MNDFFTVKDKWVAGWGGKKALGISGKANFVENTPNFSSGYDYNFFLQKFTSF